MKNQRIRSSMTLWEKAACYHSKIVGLRRKLTREGKACFVNIPKNKDDAAKLAAYEFNERQKDPCARYTALKRARATVISEMTSSAH